MGSGCSKQPVAWPPRNPDNMRIHFVSSLCEAIYRCFSSDLLMLQLCDGFSDDERKRAVKRMTTMQRRLIGVFEADLRVAFEAEVYDYSEKQTREFFYTHTDYDDVWRETHVQNKFNPLRWSDATCVAV